MDMLQNIGLLDLTFIVILVISTLLGLFRGGIREILSLIGLVASVYLAFSFAEQLSTRYMAKLLPDSHLSYILTFVLIIVTTLFAIALINLLLSQLLRSSGLSLVNRVIGMLFGAARGSVICSVIVLMLAFIPGVTTQTWWKQSSFIPVFKQLTQITTKHLPDEVNQYFNGASNAVGQVASEVISPALTPAASSTQQVRPQQTTTPKPQSTQQTDASSSVDVILQSIDESLQNSEAEGSATQSNPPRIKLESTP